MSMPALSLAVFRPGQGEPVSQLVRRYAIAHPELKPKSLKQLQVCLSLVRRWAGDEITCDELFALERFEAFTAWLFEEPKHRGTEPGRPRSVRTVRGKRDYLWGLWRFAYKRKLCDEAPPDRDDLAKLKSPKEDPIAWSPDEVRRIIDAARVAPDVRWWKPAHWISFLCAAWYTSERFEALLSCRQAELDGDTLIVKACRTKDKKAGSHKLPAWLAGMIRTLPVIAGGGVAAEKRELIWPFPFAPAAMRQHYREDILKPAGLPHDRHHLFHCLRRSVLTEMVNVADMAAAQELARHSSPAITLESYISQAKLRNKRSAADVLPNPASRPVAQLALF